MRNFKSHARIFSLLCILILALLVTVSCDKDSSDPAATDGGTDGTESSTGACAHEATEWIIDKAATCTEKGSKHKECASCKASLETAVIPSTAHTEEIVAGKLATCSEAGLTDGKICSVCKAVLAEQEALPLLRHTEEIIEGKAATCLEAGLTSGKKCSSCQTILVEQEEIPAKNHTAETVPGKKPSCSESGLSDGQKCSECQTVLVEQQELAKLGHSESDWIIDKNAEVGVEGSKHVECTRCREVLKTEAIPATDEAHVHEAKEWVTATPATCTQTGTKNLICDCGHIMETATIDITDHAEEVVPGKAPSCSAEGLTDGTKCSECGITLTEQTAIPVVPHTEEKLLGTSASCTSTGLTEGKKCSVCGKVLVSQTVIAQTNHTEVPVLGTAATCTASGLTSGKKCSVCGTVTVSQLVIPPTGHSFSSGSCTSCGIGEPYGIWIVDGQGNPMTDIIVKIMKNGEQVKMYPYKGEFLSIDLESGTYQIVLDLSQLSDTYVYDESLCLLTPKSKTATIRLFKALSADTSVFVGAPISADYPAYYISEGSSMVTLTPNDYTFFIFSPQTAAVYTVTYECDYDLAISYHGGSFFVQGTDLTGGSSDISKYENGISMNVYASNIGGEFVIGVKSTAATSCILNIKNAGDPGTRIEDAPWTPYLEDAAKVEEQLNMSVSGTYTTIDLTDLTVKAVYNEADGYYHLGSETGPIIFIDLTSDSRFVSSIQTICGYQRMGTYIYDINGKIVEKRSYNELFLQYGMPDNADTAVDPPIRVPLTKKLAEAIQTFGDKNGWWKPDSDTNIFTKALLGAAYNQEYAWLLYCGYYA